MEAKWIILDLQVCLLELTTFFIGSEIASYQLFQRLELLSSMDVLTGTLNRNAWEKANLAIGTCFQEDVIDKKAPHHRIGGEEFF